MCRGYPFRLMLAIGCGCLMGEDVVTWIGGKWALKCEDGGGAGRFLAMIVFLMSIICYNS